MKKLEAKNGKIVIRGLKDVAAAETRISFVDPNGNLFYAGYNIHDLANYVSYAEVIYLLWFNRLPNKKELTTFRSRLVSEMTISKNVKEILKKMHATCPDSHPIDLLRSVISYIGFLDQNCMDKSENSNYNKAIKIVSKLPAIVAGIYRNRIKKDFIEPDPELDVASNFLFMFRGIKPNKDEREIINRYMVLHADHGLNASTFAARVTSSTRSDLYSSITSAIGTLKGPLHGGASERVLTMLDDISNLHEVEDYIQGMLDDKKRIMGFGHRVYRTEDPRTTHLRKISERLTKHVNGKHLYLISKRIEEVVFKKKGIFPNVDFYAATMMTALGIPRIFFTSFFASSRVAGWVAHVLEQYHDNRLIRPTSKYIGKYGIKFIPLEERFTI